MRQSCVPQELFEHPQEVIRIEVPTMQIGKHEIAIFPTIPLLESLLQLLNSMLLEQLSEKNGKANQPLSCRRFRLRLNIPVFGNVIYRMKHEQRATLKIDVR